ncbi:alkaline phosphatase D family protein [Catenovulum sp. 2E275]|uniref:alkaline phosphatase D family protein n=1 Tax=Catenovulum sp. 2E275 TaxID=2980497 RepID=UPI0021CE8E1F|nr:alkaline phosphatase D family protein [Catenovulum sp. 2E275]MCU4675026.1 alkaline phosphatase D family protein [Catenovulum sp. 2E275]
MKSIDRRTLLKAIAGLGGAGVIGSFFPFNVMALTGERRGIFEYPSFKINPFQLGVASGDPATDGFVIWTRLAPEPLAEHAGMNMVPIRVSWDVAEDPNFKKIVLSGKTVAAPELGHSVHVEVEGLKPNREYWYRFNCGGEKSLYGRSKTLPLAGSSVDKIKFAVAGCQSIEHGYYTAWNHIANEDLDFVFHYGDYIYEYKDHGIGPVPNRGQLWQEMRQTVGQEIYSIEDYRRRYALYKLDINLQRAHAAAPWFVSFDDHEIDNNWASDTDQDGSPAHIFQFRKAMAFQAYYENMPLRLSSLPMNNEIKLYRSAQYGNLLNAFILDTRQYRSDQVAGGSKALNKVKATFSDKRTMLGEAQEKWLFKGLENSDTKWNLLAQQVLIGHLSYGQDSAGQDLYGMDGWSGYLHSRRRLLNQIEKHGLGRTVIVSGDSHRHYACDLMQDNDDKVIASEFLATSITSGMDGSMQDDFTNTINQLNPHLKATVNKRGYTLCTVTPEYWQADLKIVDKVMTPDSPIQTYRSFVLEQGKAGMKQV